MEVNNANKENNTINNESSIRMALISNLGANASTLSNEQLVFVNSFISNMKNIQNNNSNDIPINPFLGYSQTNINPFLGFSQANLTPFLGYSQSNISLNNSSDNYLPNKDQNISIINELKANLTNNLNNHQIKDGKEHRPIQTQYYKRKRNYNEMSIESSSRLSNSDMPFNTRKLKSSSKEDYEDLKETKKAIHYYYTDKNGYEWCFTEVNGSSKDYYYKCSTTKCKGFAMKDKLNINSNLRLTKSHTIPYFEHTYSLNIYCEDNFNIHNNEFSNYFKTSKIFRKSFLRYYVSIKENVTEYEIIGYLNAKGITDIDNSIKNDISKAFISNKVFKNIRTNIVDGLNNIKLGNEINIVFSKIYSILDNDIPKSYNMYF